MEVDSRDVESRKGDEVECRVGEGRRVGSGQSVAG